METEIRDLLRERAEDVRVEHRIPPTVLRQARRRRAVTALAAAGIAAVVVAAGVVGARSLLDGMAAEPRVTRPAEAPPDVYPFVYPPRENLATIQEQVAQGSMPMWTEPEGVAQLFAVNVLGWDPGDVAVSKGPEDLADWEGAGPETLVVRNPALPEASRFEGGLGTTLYLFPIPGSDPAIYAVMVAWAEAIDLEPVGPDAEFGSRRTLAFRGRLAFVPDRATVVLTHRDAHGAKVEASAPIQPDGTFLVSVDAPTGVASTDVVSVALQDAAGRTLALTSSMLASPVPVEGTTSERTGRAEALPALVVEKRDALIVAAEDRDWQVLRELIPDRGFDFSFGVSDDPIAYWKDREAEGEPVLDILTTLLEGPWARNEPTNRGEILYVWPAPSVKPADEWNRKDIAILRRTSSAREIELYRDLGHYIGWRVGIWEDGTWSSFIAGD
jgi:hypothetical protein